MKKDKLLTQPKADVFTNSGIPPEIDTFEPFEEVIQALQSPDSDLIDPDIEEEEAGNDFILPESYHIQEDPFLDPINEDKREFTPHATSVIKDFTKKTIVTK